MPASSLSGRTVLITGAAGLLGIEHTVAVAKAGGLPVMLDIDKARLASSAGRVAERTGARIETRLCDITSRPALEDLRRELDASLGLVHGLVNNAAINPTMAKLDGKPSGAFETYPVDEWNRELAVGLTGSLLCAQVFGAAMADAGEGSIVNIASDLGVFAPDHRIYSASQRIEDVVSFKPVSYPVCKAAVIGLTKYIATYWAHRGVRCNAIAPGGAEDGQSETLIRNIADRTPMRRMARPNEFQGALVFLLSDASSFMTGETLVIDGGRNAW